MKARILPFMEQAQIWNAMNVSADFNANVNATAGSTNIQAFLCPSDNNMIQRVGTGYNGRDFGDTNYFNNLGTVLSLNSGMLDGPAYIMGAPAYGPTVTLAGITDGTSNTAIMGEILMGNSSSGTYPVTGPGTPAPGSIWLMSIAYTTTSPANPNLGNLGANLAYISSTYCQSSKNLSTFSTLGFAWSSDAIGTGGGYNHSQAPNSKSCFGNNQNSDSPIGSAGVAYQYGAMVTAHSNHPGGVNMAFIDGSVHFIKNTVSLGTYGSLGTRSGGEILDASSY